MAFAIVFVLSFSGMIYATARSRGVSVESNAASLISCLWRRPGGERTTLARWIGVGCATGLFVSIVLTGLWQISDAVQPDRTGLARMVELSLFLFWPPSLIMLGAHDVASLHVGWSIAAVANALLYGVVGALCFVGASKTRWRYPATAFIVALVILWWWYSSTQL